MQSMYNWRDYTGHCMRPLGDILVAVQQSLKPFDIGKDFKEMEEEEKDYMNNKT